MICQYLVILYINFGNNYYISYGGGRRGEVYYKQIFFAPKNKFVSGGYEGNGNILKMGKK